jgi:integrase
MDDAPARVAGRTFLLRHHPPHAWATVVERGRGRRSSLDRRAGRRAVALCAASLRHTHAVEMAHEGVPLIVVQRQLGHSNLGIASISLQGIDNSEIIDSRRAPTVPVSASLRF